MIFDAGNFYYFGGVGATTSILRLNAATWTWSNVGSLNSPRLAHGVILVENTFMVIGGGDGTKANEACILNDGGFTCEEKSSSLTQYQHSPLLFVVDDNYGTC